MNVVFYDFAKRNNSTKIPTGTGTTLTCRLKENTSEHNPVIIVKGSPKITYNYAYIGQFLRYYFVRDMISLANDLTEYHLEEDVLASHKTAIGATKARVAFASQRYDSTIIDSRMAVCTTRKVHASSLTTNIFSTNGCYILTVFANASGSSTGMGTSYMLNQANMNIVKQWFGDTTISADIANYMEGDLLKACLGCIWVPFPYGSDPNINTAVTSLDIGNHNSSADGFSISGYKLITAKGISATGHLNCHLYYPQTDFRSAEPYTTGNVFLPGVGCVDINMSDWLGSSKINVTVTLEYLTGNVQYLLIRDDGAIVQTINCNVAANCPLGQMNTNGNSLLSSIGGAAGGFVGLMVGALTGGVGAVVGGAAALIAGASSAALSANKRAASITGGTGGTMCTVFPYITHTEYAMETENVGAADYIATKGLPLAQVDTLSNLAGGYIQCDDASVSIAGDETERQAINNYLNSGFYYE